MNPTAPPTSDFLPTTAKEMHALGWDRLDVILVTGDTYIDSPYMGAMVIGRVLADAGFRVGIIAQPNVDGDQDIARLGEPVLFWGVTGGSVDSLVANRTALGKPRRKDDLTPGGINSRRPDRAVIVYSNLIRRCFKQTRPIVLGGIEASLRRISHYDVWSDRVRRSILFDAKAELLVYGMGEKSVLEVARALKQNTDVASIRGICYISPQAPAPSDAFPGPDILLPAHALVVTDKDAFIEMFGAFYANTDPHSARRIIQQQDTRFLVHNPPAYPLTAEELDRVYELPYTQDVHPYYAAQGTVTALETIRFALTTHRGCYGECRFCAIAVHQGRQVVSRSQASLLREAVRFTQHACFKGIIADVGGPTANMYGFECRRKIAKGACAHKGCLFPRTCDQLPVDHRSQLELLRALRRLPGVRKVFVRSGLRHDLVLADARWGRQYLQTLLRHHVSGQLKIAPEHVEEQVLQSMGKPGRESLEAFLELFRQVNSGNATKVYLTYYLLAAHPGCTLAHMQALRKYALGTLRLLPEQVQIFTASPSTFSTLMYHTHIDPFTRSRLFVEYNSRRKQEQKEAVLKSPRTRRRRKGCITCRR